MYHVSAQGVDEHMINVHYYYLVSQFSVKKQNTTGVSLSVELCTFAYILLQDLVSHLESHTTKAQWVC